ncbi:MAG: prepilin-type N-terminal cleavage/methylation domain-containing protein [Bacteriovoracaceae bacterium]|jgi:type IV pilus assembly protein PilV|nr:prepilin-type N-terminal cleavage/methylation domain-containing protein [Bacteriovoracaceae bacterium]HNR51768.1 prepilin-type N-terminal cleavage/methylation domain-containing protein [Deltaproteobacteria bacterium]HRR68444.1 prepilin-type N-terminal cleavage/methylation domain-containing protein [Desulfomonilia bacterium]HRT44688.1 prepilin-type N-terminal cleavage/methylation domain-containing protein [Desulfomonilia bacterium]
MGGKGFTLIELVIAILVFAVGILGIVKMQSLSITGNSYGMHMSQAVNIAQDKLEELQNLSITSDTFNDGTPNALVPQYIKTINGTDYSIEYNVKTISGLGTKEVEIVVGWPEVLRNPSISITFVKR